MDEFATIYYWLLKLVSPLLIFGGAVTLVIGFPERTLGFIMVPAGLLGLTWAWMMRRKEGR